MAAPSLDELRRYAVNRSLFSPTSLSRAMARLGFVQADPIRAPARAQDLTLRPRVKNYRAGDLERRYSELDVEEDFFINYGFITRRAQSFMHPRSGLEPVSKARARQAQELLVYVAERGAVHPREVDRHFAAGTELNYWGGSSNTTTRLLDSLHYRGLLRVARRETGIRMYALAPARPVAPASSASEALDELVDLLVRKYAPLPAISLSSMVHRLRYAAPQWRGELKAAVLRAKRRLGTACVGGVHWFWPPEDRVRGRRGDSLDASPAQVRLLAPFDPVVWDRFRFEIFWGWRYRFEAYTPVARRRLGYYALPLLWQERVIGWGNLSFAERRLSASFGYVSGKPPRDPAFRRALSEELARFEHFLG
jgi:uncharacterized protein YcaQ